MKDIKVKVVFFCIIQIALFGCSTISYVEPVSGKLARVRFVTDTTSVTTVRNYETSSCEGESEWMRLRNGNLYNSSPKKMGMPLWNYHDNSAKEFYLYSNREYHFMISGSGRKENVTYLCGVPLSVSLEEGKDYEISFHLSIGSCLVDFKEIAEDDNSNYIFNKIERFVNTDYTKDQSCKKNFSRVRLY